MYLWWPLPEVLTYNAFCSQAVISLSLKPHLYLISDQKKKKKPSKDN